MERTPYKSSRSANTDLSLCIGIFGQALAGCVGTYAGKPGTFVVYVHHTKVSTRGVEEIIAGLGEERGLHRTGCGGVQAELMHKIAKTNQIVLIRGILDIITVR